MDYLTPINYFEERRCCSLLPKCVHNHLTCFRLYLLLLLLSFVGRARAHSKQASPTKERRSRRRYNLLLLLISFGGQTVKLLSVDVRTVKLFINIDKQSIKLSIDIVSMIKLLNYYLFIVINCQNVCQNLTHFLSQFDTNFWCQNLTSNFDEFEPQICQILPPPFVNFDPNSC